MTRAALALLLTTAAPLVVAQSALAQTAPDLAQQPSSPATTSDTTTRPAGDALPATATAEERADQGATPTSGQDEAQRREGVTVYQPDFFAASRPNTALDMIGRLPGFQLDRGSSARGFAGTAGNVLIDGQRPASKSDTVDSVVSRIPAARVERIEVIRGGAPGIDMQGQSVVANVIVRAGDTFEQTVTLGDNLLLPSGDNLPSATYQVNRTVGSRTYEASIGRGTSLSDATNGGRRIRRDPAGIVIRDEEAGTEGDGVPYSARGSIKTPLIGGELRANGTLAKSDFKDETHFRRPGVRTDSIGVSDSLSGEVGLNYTRPLNERLSMELVGLQRLAKSEFISTFEQNGDRSVFTSDADSGESIARGVLRLRRSATLSFEAGGEAAFNFRQSLTALTDNGAPVSLPSSEVRIEERRGEAFITATWRPFTSLGVEAGSRFESSTISQSGDTALERSFFYPKPRLLLTWTPTPADTVRFRLEREVGQLNFGDFAASANLTDDRIVAGNSQLEPDKTVVLEMSVERRFWETGAITLEYEHEEITDAIDRLPIFAVDPDTGATFVFDAPGNIGEGTTDEIDVEITLPLGRFGVPGGEFKFVAGLSRSEVTDPTTGQARRISGQNQEDIRIEFRQDLPRYKLTYGGSLANGFDTRFFRFNEVSRDYLDRLSSAFVEYKPDPRTSLRLEASNILPYTLDEEREVFAGPRDTSPLLFTEIFTRESQHRISFRLRRVFG